MISIPYSMLIKNSKHPEVIREEMVKRYYETLNYSQVGREYGCKRQTVKFWVLRFEKKGIEGLKDKPKAPHHIPHKTPSWIEDEIEKIAKSKKCSLGQDRIQLELRKQGIRKSTSTINRIMNERDLIKKRKKKWKKKKQIQEYRKKLKALRFWQIDVKDLIDIPNIYALVEAGIIPRYQYSAKDVITRTAFVAYAWEYNILCSIRFVQALLEHLKRFGIHSSEIVIQTDNGPEFIGSITKKEPSGFEKLIENVYHGKHQTIPIGKKEYNGSVENFHQRIENEFYDIEIFNSLRDFLSKAWTFTLYWNLEREILQLKKTPFQLIKEKCHIFDPEIANFQPFILNEMKTFWIPHYLQKSVPYVADELTFCLQQFLITYYLKQNILIFCRMLEY